MVPSDWLARALEESKNRGFLGPGPIEDHVRHAEGFVRAWEDTHGAPPHRLLDLGAGGGIPGLVIAERWGSPTVLLDSVSRRTAFLLEVLSWPGSPESVSVETGRAEVAARDPRFERTFELVVARSFGPPAVTAECASRFVVLGGSLIVAEPPEPDPVDRWPESKLLDLGWSPKPPVRHGASFRELVKVGETPAAYPRPVGRPTKRPLF